MLSIARRGIERYTIAKARPSAVVLRTIRIPPAPFDAAFLYRRRLLRLNAADQVLQFRNNACQ